jgi:hypothetical protein
MPPELIAKCEFYNDCKNDKTRVDHERVELATFKGIVETKLTSIEKGVGDIWTAVNKGRDDIRDLYFKVGLISGGTSLIVSLIVSFVIKAVV